jgi:hypothetical protein
MSCHGHSLVVGMLCISIYCPRDYLEISNTRGAAPQVISETSASFYRDLTFLGSAPIPRPLTDCYNYQVKGSERSED